MAPTQGIFQPYIYSPSIPAAIVGAVVFPLISVFLTYQYFRYKSWFFWPAILGVSMYTIGFICRAVSATNEHHDLPFLISFIMTLLAPSLIAAACYVTFSRVVWFSCPTDRLSFRTLWCFPRWITPTFVTFDLLSFIVQCIGAAIITRSYDHDTDHDGSIEDVEANLTSGRVILVLGLILQMSCFAAFAVIALRYFFISRTWRADDLGDWNMWRKLNTMIHVAAALTTLRALYRTVEIPQDRRSGLLYLQSHEWCFWIFDAVPVFATLVVISLHHPGRYLPRSWTRLRLDKRVALLQKGEVAGGSVQVRDLTFDELGGRERGG